VDNSNNSAPLIRAALPCFVKQSKIGAAYCSLPYFGPNAGVIADPNDEHLELWHKLLIEAAIKDARSLGALSFVVYSPLVDPRATNYREVLPQGTIEVEKITQTSKLGSSFKLSSKILRDVKRGKDAGFRVSRNLPVKINEFWDTYAERCEFVGIPIKSKQFVTNLATKLVDEGLADYYVAATESTDDFVAGLILLKSTQSASYYIPCFDQKYRKQQPMSLLLATALNNCSNEGLSLWNWESSPSVDHPVYAYKRRWGAEHSTYRIYVTLLKPISALREIGAENISSALEYFFVVPFTELNQN
jgi:hypothetical protein